MLGYGGTSKMNSFLPYPDLQKSAACLDMRRQGKQRVEYTQMLLALYQGPKVIRDISTKKILWNVPLEMIGCNPNWKIVSTPWYNHPCTQMWKGFEILLEIARNECILEWKKEHNNSMLFSSIIFEPLLDYIWVGGLEVHGSLEYPDWWGGPVHPHYRAALLYKGWLDKTCEAIPKPVDKWLKERYFPTKQNFKTRKELFDLQGYLNWHPKLEDTFYYQYGWKEEPEINYIWPTKEEVK